jgi:hypothetical protein
MVDAVKLTACPRCPFGVSTDGAACPECGYSVAGDDAGTPHLVVDTEHIDPPAVLPPLPPANPVPTYFGMPFRPPPRPEQGFYLDRGAFLLGCVITAGGVGVLAWAFTHPDPPNVARSPDTRRAKGTTPGEDLRRGGVAALLVGCLILGGQAFRTAPPKRPKPPQ